MSNTMNITPQTPGLPSGYDQSTGTVPANSNAPAAPANTPSTLASVPPPSGVPMLAPDGGKWTIPVENVDAATKSGYKIAVDMTAPDGGKWRIPFDNQDAAQKAGYKWDDSPKNESTKTYVKSQQPSPLATGGATGTVPGTPLGSMGASTSAGQAGDSALGGLTQSATDQIGGVMHAITHPVSTIIHSTPLGDLTDSVKQASSLFDAYEKARSSGASIGDAVNVVNQQAAAQEAATNNVKQAVDAFRKNPGQESVRQLANLVNIALGVYGGAGAPEAAAEEVPEEEAATASQPAPAETTATAPSSPSVNALSGDTAATPAENVIAPKSTPTIMQKTSQGLFASPEGAEEAASGPKVIQALRDFAGDTSQGPIRKALDKPISDGYADFKSQYRVIDDAADTDFKNLYDKLDDANEKARLAAPGSMEEASAEKARASVTDAIEDAKAQAKERGVDNIDDLLDKADARFQQVQALKDVRAKLYQNQSIIKGNAAHGVDEFGKVNNAIDAVERLDSANKFGASRIAQTPGGPDSVFKLKQALYDAQTEGLRAQARQQSFQLGKKSVPIVHNVIDAARAIKNVVRP
jgi:hypothetical protein